jgi:hypothetical protein
MFVAFRQSLPLQTSVPSVIQQLKTPSTSSRTALPWPPHVANLLCPTLLPPRIRPVSSRSSSALSGWTTPSCSTRALNLLAHDFYPDSLHLRPHLSFSGEVIPRARSRVAGRSASKGERRGPHVVSRVAPFHEERGCVRERTIR